MTTERDLRARKMWTPLGKALRFELRQISRFTQKGKLRTVWIVVFESAPGRLANLEEKRLWQAIPKKMREVP